MPKISFESYRIKNSGTATHLSYGLIKGCYQLPPESSHNIILEIISDKNYALIEKRTDFFKLFWDLDLKQDIIKELGDTDLSQFIAFLINQIIYAIKYYIDLDSDELEYIYCDKDSGNGVHLYFPKIIVNSAHALVIRNKLLELCPSETYPDITQELYHKIIDESVFKSNGIRLIHQTYNGAYYRINRERSTYRRIPKDLLEQLELTSIRTKECSEKWYPTYDDNNYPVIYTDLDIFFRKTDQEPDKAVHNNNANRPKRTGKINQTEVEEIANNLKFSRIDNYETWRDFVFMCKNEGLNELAHKVSQRSKKYDSKSVDKILNSNKAVGKQLTLGSLYYWSKTDNPVIHETIIAKYRDSKRLKINHTDEYLIRLLPSFKNRYMEDSKYISDAAYDTISPHKTIILHSPTGSGKTTILKRLKDSLIEPDVISVISRRTMAATHKATLELSSYIDGS